MGGFGNFVDPAGVTRLRAKGGGGGSMPNALKLLGPFSLDFDTAGFLNPANNGVNTIPIPAGSFVKAYAIVTAAFDGAQPGDELNLLLLTGPTSSGLSLAEYSGEELGPGILAPGIAFYEPKLLSADAARLHRAGVAAVDCFIVAGLFMSDPVTQGSLDIYAWVATPTP